MAQLTDSDRSELLRVAKLKIEQLPLRHEERFVAPTVEARERYIRFATQASKFFKGTKPVCFEGDCWKL